MRSNACLAGAVNDQSPERKIVYARRRSKKISYHSVVSDAQVFHVTHCGSQCHGKKSVFREKFRKITEAGGIPLTGLDSGGD
jgi:hypothetical protein